MVNDSGQDAPSETWELFSDSIGQTFRVIIDPDVYLKYVIGPPGLDGFTQDDLDRSIAAAVNAYVSGLTDTALQHGVDPGIVRTSYVPPKGWQRGGAIGAPWEVIEFFQNAETYFAIVGGVASTILADAVRSACRRFLGFLRDSGVPPQDWKLPSHDPILVRALCQSHALSNYPHSEPAKAVLYPGGAPSPDFPEDGGVFTVVIPYRSGSIVYVVTDRLLPLNIIRAHSKGSIALDKSTWFESMRPEPIQDSV